jgi:hypothetical protein
MKIILSLLLLVTINAFSQKPNVKLNSKGVYITLKKQKDTVKVEKFSGKYFLEKDSLVPVYINEKNRLYIYRISKAKLKKYKYYLFPKN